MAVPEVFRSNVEWLLMQVGNKSREIAENILQRYGVNVREMTVIRLIDGHKYSQQAIANYLALNKNTVVDIVDSLEAKRLAERHKNPDNRREQIIELTQKGHKLLVTWAKHDSPQRYWVSQILQKHECLVLENLLLRLLDTQVERKVGGIENRVKFL